MRSPSGAIEVAFILPKEMVRPVSGLGLDRVGRAAVAKENRLVAPPIRGSSFVVVV